MIPELLDTALMSLATNSPRKSLKYFDFNFISHPALANSRRVSNCLRQNEKERKNGKQLPCFKSYIE